MSTNPVSELKRRLDDDSAPLSKRLCLARNVAGTHYLPTAAKERALTDWLSSVEPCEEVVRSVLEWKTEGVSAELQRRLIEVVAKYLESNTLELELAEKIIYFLENDKFLMQLTLQSESFLFITRTLLKQFQQMEASSNVLSCQRLLENITKVFKAVIRKVDFIVKFLDGETLEVVFSYLKVPELRGASLKVCQTVLFPVLKKPHFATFLQTLIKKESIDQLLEEKGDNIKSVVKIMSTFFTFPKGRTSKDADFLFCYIDAFGSSFKSDSHLIFAFYTVVINSLNIQQTYLNPTMSMPVIHFEENDAKVKRYVFFKALECLKENDIDLNVRLTENIAKVEIKKNFMSLLQAALLNTLKLEGKPDKITLKIISLALRLDPNLIEPKMDKILPNIMTSKKTNCGILEAYREMLDCLLETLFKLSRGTEFLSQVLPLLKLQLEAINTEQFEMKQQLKSLDNEARDKLKSKIIVGEDLFPKSCVERYGKLTSELTLRQNGELFVTLQKEFETHCLILLCEGFVSPSLITLSEVFAAILSSVLTHSKMADHTVPLHIAQEFWNNFQLFETELLAKYAECLLSLSYNYELTLSFLQLCVSFLNLKLLNARYGNVKVGKFSLTNTGDIDDFSLVLPCLSTDQWVSIASRVRENQDGGCLEALNQLQLQKVLACELHSFDANNKELDRYKQVIKSILIKELSSLWNLIEKSPLYTQVLFHNLEASTEQNLSKSLVKMFESDPSTVSVLSSDAISNNRSLLTNLVLETLKSILKIMEDETFLQSNKSVRKAIKAGFEFEEIAKGCDVLTLFEQLSNPLISQVEENVASILNYLDLLKSLHIPWLDENCQLLSIFVILALKRTFSSAKSSKKIKKILDALLLNMFELSPKHPDLYKVFPIKYMFSFEEDSFLGLVTLNRIKSSRSIVVKAILELAVKKVKTDSEVVRSVVKILLSNQKVKKNQDSSIKYFSDEVFQITCMILPIIAKEKRAITISAYRSILADLQEKLHKSLLKSFKNVDFSLNKSLFLNKTENFEESLSVEMSDSTLATLNAVEAYSLTLSKYCGSTTEEDSSNLDCLLESLEYFSGNAISAIRNTDSKLQHVDASVQLLNIILRNTRKLATHEIFKEKDLLFLQIWQAVKCRLSVMLWANDEMKNAVCLDEMAVTIKLVSELCSVDFFATHVAVDLNNLMALKAPAAVVSLKDSPNSVLTSHRVAKYLWTSILKGNVIGLKSAALSKAMHRASKNFTLWLRTHFDGKMPIDAKSKSINETMIGDDKQDVESEVVAVKSNVDDEIYEVLKCDMDALSEAIMNAKKASTEESDIAPCFLIGLHPANKKYESDKTKGILCPLLGDANPYGWATSLPAYGQAISSYMESVSEPALKASYRIWIGREREITLSHRFLDAIFELQQRALYMLGAGGVYRTVEPGWGAFLQLADGLLAALNALLWHREELLEDRWPCYLQCYRGVVECLCRRATFDLQVDRHTEERLAETAHTVEKLTQAMCKRRGQVSRLAAYLVADLCCLLERLAPARVVRQHLGGCVALLIQASEGAHAAAFLRRALAGGPGQMTMFNLYTMYKRYHKYVGAS